MSTTRSQSSTTLDPKGSWLNMKKIRRALGKAKGTRKARKRFASKNGLSTISPTLVNPGGGYEWSDDAVLAFLVESGILPYDPEFIDATVTAPKGIAEVCSPELGVTVTVPLALADKPLSALGYFLVFAKPTPIHATCTELRHEGHPDGPLGRQMHTSGLATPSRIARVAPKAPTNTSATGESEGPKAPRASREERKQREPKAPANEPGVLGDFPEDKAFAVAQSLRKAVRMGETTESEDLPTRRLVRWAWIYRVLRGLGVEQKQAFSLSFKAVMLDSLPPDEGDYLTTVFQTEVGYVPDLKWPAALEKIRQDMERKLQKIARPEAALAAVLLRAGVPVWMWGPKGGGKTEGAHQAMAYLGYADPLRFQGSRHTEVPDLFGGKGLTVEDGASRTIFEDGGLTLAARQGRAVIMDEWDRMTDAVRHECHALLDGDQQITVKHTGEVLPFTAPVAALCNTAGLGESPAYADTGVTDAATRDRFAFIYMDELDEAIERQILHHEITRLTSGARLRTAGAPETEPEPAGDIVPGEPGTATTPDLEAMAEAMTAKRYMEVDALLRPEYDALLSDDEDEDEDADDFGEAWINPFTGEPEV